MNQKLINWLEPADHNRKGRGTVLSPDMGKVMFASKMVSGS
jgi:hypothetical protein